MLGEEYSRKGLVKAIKSNRIYDYIANHYTEMGTYDLKEVLLAVLGVCYDQCLSEDEKRLMSLIEEELVEHREFGGDD